MSRVFDLALASILYGVRAPAEQVKAWAERRGVPAVIIQGKSGWTWLMALVDERCVVGARPPATFEALRELYRLGQAVMMDQEEVWGAANGTIKELPNDYQMPEWEIDLAGIRGVMFSAAGSDLSSVHAVGISPTTVVQSGPWAIAATDTGLGSGLIHSMVQPDHGPVVTLDRKDEEVNLAVLVGGELQGLWAWNSEPWLVCHPPPGLRLPVDVSWLYHNADPRIVFQGAPGVNVDRLARAVAGRAPGATVVAELVAALGLPAFVAEHLAGSRELADQPGAVVVPPAKGLRGMLALWRFRRFL